MEQYVFAVILLTIFLISGFTAMVFAFKLDYEHMKTASLLRRVFWYYGVWFFTVITTSVIISFVLMVLKFLIGDT